MEWKNDTNYMPSMNVRFSLFVEDAFSSPRLEVEVVMSISNRKFKLDAVFELCDCLLLARLAGRFC
jgi:hypothetical protein